MSWTYQPFDDDSVKKVISSLAGKLAAIENSDGAIAAQGAKVVISDQHDGDARGVVFYNPSLSSVPGTVGGNVAWETTTNTSRTDYTDLYNDILSQLENLPADQAFWSKVMFTNRKDGDATMTISTPAPSEA